MTDKEVIKLAQGLITALKCDSETMVDFCNTVIKKFEQQPCEDCISRQVVIRLVEQYPNIIGNRCSGLIADIKHLPSVTPNYNLESYSDKLWKNAYERGKADAKQTEWIPVKWRIKTEVEEYEQYPEGVVMLDCPMPTEGEDVLITIKGKSGQVWVEKDTALKDEDGWYTDGGYEWVDDIIAWMPLPEPYKEENKIEQALAYADQDILKSAT